MICSSPSKHPSLTGPSTSTTWPIQGSSLTNTAQSPGRASFVVPHLRHSRHHAAPMAPRRVVPIGILKDLGQNQVPVAAWSSWSRRSSVVWLAAAPAPAAGLVAEARVLPVSKKTKCWPVSFRMLMIGIPPPPQWGNWI